MQNFSFFTYFQFVQNDIVKIIVNSVISEKDIEKNFNLNENLLSEGKNEYACKTIDEIKTFFFNIANFLFNINKYLSSLFKDKNYI